MQPPYHARLHEVENVVIASVLLFPLFAIYLAGHHVRELEVCEGTRSVSKEKIPVALVTHRGSRLHVRGCGKVGSEARDQVRSHSKGKPVSKKPEEEQ